MVQGNPIKPKMEIIMGYCSEVAFAIKPEKYSSFIECIPENTEAIKDLIQRGTVYHKEYGILIHWKSIEWHGKIVDKFMHSLNTVDWDSYKFFELGEDVYDNPTIEGGWDENPFDLCISRSLSIDV